MTGNDEPLAAQLLGELGWVRRLAVQLAGGHGDDVAQEAWLVAAGQRPATDRPLRPWLATVVRTLAHTRARGEARRRAHEGGAAHEAARAETPTPEASLEKAELLHLLGELVGRLEEPYRATIMLRYYEGLTSQQIAARHNVSDGTVRWRLKHAVESLRRQLDERVDGGRRAWSLAFARLPGFTAVAKGGSMVTFFKMFGAAAVVAVGGAATVRAMRGWHDHARPPAAVVAPSPSRNQSPARASDPPSDTLEQAQQAYIHGRYDDAIKLAHEVEGDEPQRAWRVIGASSCFLQDSAGAATAWQKLDGPGRKFVEYVCKRNEVTLPAGAPIM